MNPAETAVLVPPRPNLGPEPWPELDEWSLGLWIASGLCLVLTLAAAWRHWSRKRRSAPPAAAANQPNPLAAPDNPLVELAAVARQTLGSLPGASWPSRTTEEIARDLELRKRLGDPHFERLIELLARADHIKFSAEPPTQLDPYALENWTAWTAALPARLQAHPPQGKGRASSATSSTGTTGLRTT